MVLGIIARIVAFVFLLFHELIFLGMAIRALRELLSRSPDANLTFSLLFLLLSLILSIWLLGLMRQVVSSGWPEQAYKKVRAEKRKYLATLLVLIGLAVLFATPLAFYAAIGHSAGSNFALQARLEYLHLFGLEVPAFITVIVAWVFQWHYASFIVGFFQWIGLSLRKKPTKKTANQQKV